MKKMMFILAFIVVAFSLTWSQEVLLNGNFESWDTSTSPTSWTHVENTTQESTAEFVHGGTYSAKHLGGTKDLGQTISGIIAGDDYDLSLWYKVTAGDATTARIWSYWKNGSTSLSDNGAELRGPNNSYFDNNGGVWTQYSVTVTAPATADGFYFEVRTYSGGTVYWDDFSFSHVATASPTIILNPTSLTGFNYSVGNGPSAEQTFTAEGTNLTNDITLTASTNYEISETSGTGYTSPITLTQSAGTVSTTTIYVRLKAGLSAGDYNAETIAATSSGATSKNVTCSGSVDAPTTTTLPYSETFDADLGNCYTYSVSGATKEWYWSSAYAGINGYDSGDVEEDWLILPGINLDSYTDEIMTFDSWYQFGADDVNNYLKLYYSTDYSGVGDPSSSTWTELSYTQPSAATTWTGSGNIDLSAISGTSVWIGFKYHYNSGSYRSWHIDTISIAEVHNIAPAINNIVQTPASNIGTSTTVSVSADVTDSDGTISSVELHWGVASGNLGTTISMSNGGSGDTYTTSTDIPAQSEGTTVYYEVYAVDDGGATTTSDEASYFVTDAATPNVGDVYISELSDEKSGESYSTAFMEISNNTSTPINMTNSYIERWSSGGAYDNYTYTFGAGVTIPADGSLIVARGADQTTFETAWGIDFSSLNSNFDSGNSSLYFVTGRSYKLYSPSAKAELDSTPTVNSGNRVTQSSGGTWSSEESSSNSTPGEPEPPLPVVLSSFYAEFAANELAIVWTTQSESNLSGWNVYKANSNDFDLSEKLNAALIPAAGTATQTTNYRYVDNSENVNSGETYYYWLESTDLNGMSTLTDPISYTIPENDNPDSPDLNAKYGLSQNYPNPFNPTTEIKFRLANDSNAKLEIYNIKGQRIETLFDGFAEADQEITKVWNANNITSGVYFYKLTAGGKTYTRKMILMK